MSSNVQGHPLSRALKTRGADRLEASHEPSMAFSAEFSVLRDVEVVLGDDGGEATT